MSDDKQPWPTLELTNTGRARVMTSMPDPNERLGEPLVGVDFAELEQRVAADLANSVEALQGVYVPPIYIGDAATVYQGFVDALNKHQTAINVGNFLEGVKVFADTCNDAAAKISEAVAATNKANFGYGTIGHKAYGSMCKFNQTRNRDKKERRRLKGKK